MDFNYLLSQFDGLNEEQEALVIAAILQLLNHGKN